MKAGARAAAVQFYNLYSAGQFAASWDLLAATARRKIPRSVWVRVHDGCSATRTGKSRIIKSVTVFGDAAIVSEEVTGARPKSTTAESVFNYANGRWSYSPQDLRIYLHGSVPADIAAARAAGFCASWKDF